jgi:DNA-binding NarL/FixJ family response regulator
MTAGGPVSLRVLVCDDQELVRAGFSTILGAQPDIVVVATAADGAEAVQAARALRPDVVVMDIRMPLVDGIEATRQLAGPGVADPVKVLVVTTFNLDEYVFEALRAGASGFLLKDTRPAELIAAIRTVAAGDTLLAPAVTRHLIGHYADRIRSADRGRSDRDRVLDLLAPREVEVLRLIAAGLANAEIAAALVISPETVKTYVSRIFTKLGLRDRIQAVILAFRSGLADTDH